MSDVRCWRGTAQAKVNLLLRVLAREESGYHQLETVFQALELGDGVELELRDEPVVTLEVAGVPAGDLGPDEDNLAVRAVKAFLEAVESADRREGPGAEGVVPGVIIRLEKRVPHGAGLGGGSSDAAVVLRGLNELHGGLLEQAELLRLGGGLGADVAFFLTGASRALAWGRGDRLLRLPSLPVREVVVAAPGERTPTPEAYRLLAQHRERTGAGAAPPALVWVAGPDASSGRAEAGGDGPSGADPWERVAREAVNDFEAAILPTRPDVRALRDTLVEAGGRPALLAGSGSAVFGVFPGPGSADRAARELADGFPGVRTIRTRTLA